MLAAVVALGLVQLQLRVELYPERRAAEIRGSYHQVDRGDAAIDSIYMRTTPVSVETGAVTLNRAAALVLSDAGTASESAS